MATSKSNPPGKWVWKRVKIKIPIYKWPKTLQTTFKNLPLQLLQSAFKMHTNCWHYLVITGFITFTKCTKNSLSLLANYDICRPRYAVQTFPIQGFDCQSVQPPGLPSPYMLIRYQYPTETKHNNITFTDKI